MRFKTIFALTLLAALSAAYGKSTKVVNSWRNPKYSKPHFKRILVIGMSDNAPVRADFEDALSLSVTRDGVEAIPGNTLLLRPESGKLDINYVRAQVRDHQIDAVIVSRLVSVQKEVTYVPGQPLTPLPYYYSFYGYYSALYPVVYSPDYLREDKKVRIETNLYAVVGGEGDLVWTAISDTMNPKSGSKSIPGLVKEVVKQMEEDGVLAQESK